MFVVLFNFIDQLVHFHSLIKIFAVPLKKPRILALSNQCSYTEA